MKLLKTLAVCSLLAFGGQAVAKTVTPITFTKGSYCSSYEGNIKDRTFSLQTKAKQKITLRLDTMENIDRFRVKDPNGQMLKDIGNEHWEFNTKAAGKHTIIVVPQNNSQKVINAKFEVCVH